MKRAIIFFASVLSGDSAKMSECSKKIINFKEFKFVNPPSYAKLPINDDPEYNIPMAVNKAIFSKVPTEPIDNARLVCASDDCLSEILDLDPKVAETKIFTNFVAGKYLPEGGLTVCHRYGGYQFGFWADQLGDGRAHILGEYINKKGEIWQPQLKGSGETPYSRFGDGRAVLRSSIREMIGSEACHYLGIPTTRAAALVVSDDQKVWRDQKYSGNARQERVAIVMRLSQAWYRLGSVEILLKRREPELMKKFVDFIIEHYFPELNDSDENKYVNWYKEVCLRNLDMVAAWQGVGFTHGVLNTDNVSILGVTIDYGPYGFIDRYNEHYVPNSSDDMGRYSFIRQTDIMLWNLERFAESLEPLLNRQQKKEIEKLQRTFEIHVIRKVLETFIHKLGLQEAKEGDTDLVNELLNMMEEHMADFTLTFRQLGEVASEDFLNRSVIETKWSLKKLLQASNYESWVEKYRIRLNSENVSDEERLERTCKVNPLYIPRNWMLQEAIADAEKNDFEKVRFLLELFKNPYDVNEEAERRGYSSEPPSWSFGLSLSCSS